ncbi:MAG: hypothetical protein ACREEV_03520 [Dongiaceae bacterium]
MSPAGWTARSVGGALITALSGLTAPSAADVASGRASLVGIVYRGELDDLRLAIADDSLPLGSKVAIVTTPDGLVLCCAVVGAAYILRSDEFDPVYLDDEGKTTYALDPAGITADVSPAFGLAGAVPELGASGARPDLDGNGTLEGFRSCASGEGLHLTVWYGEPLSTARLWHGYYYLGYDTESNCAPKDYE